MADAKNIKLHTLIGVKPQVAVDYLRAKVPQNTWDKGELDADAHQVTFTVAKLTSAAMLQDVFDAVQAAVDDGLSMSQFREQLTDKLVTGGWRARSTDASGRQRVTETASGFMGRVDPATGEIGSRVDTPRRIETIFRTNLQSAYMAGRLKAFEANTDDRPYWQYVAVMDAKTRPEHAALNGLVFKYDDPFWDTMTPPNDYNCRCRIRALTAEDVADQGLVVENGDGQIKHSEYEYADGEKVGITGYDTGSGVVYAAPGFDGRPGGVRSVRTGVNADLVEIATRAIDKLEPSLAKATLKLLDDEAAVRAIVGPIQRRL